MTETERVNCCVYLYVKSFQIGLSLVKTFTMFVGELEFGDLPIETTVGYLFLLGRMSFHFKKTFVQNVLALINPYEV